MNYLPRLENHNGIYVVSSRVIANQLEKRHDNVIRDLDKILETSNLSSLIIPNLYRVSNQIRTYKEYLLTKDGFTLYMFNIQGYNDFKLAYINEFNKMEETLKGNKTLPFKKEKFVEVVDRIPREELISMRDMINMLTQEIKEDISKIKHILGRIEDHEAHIKMYSSILRRL